MDLADEQRQLLSYTSGAVILYSSQLGAWALKIEDDQILEITIDHLTIWKDNRASTSPMGHRQFHACMHGALWVLGCFGQRGARSCPVVAAILWLSHFILYIISVLFTYRTMHFFRGTGERDRYGMSRQMT